MIIDEHTRRVTCVRENYQRKKRVFEINIYKLDVHANVFNTHHRVISAHILNIKIYVIIPSDYIFDFFSDKLNKKPGTVSTNFFNRRLSCTLAKLFLFC